MPKPDTATLQVKFAGGSCPVHIGQGVLQRTDLWQAQLGPGRILIVSDDNVAPLYLETLRQAMPGREPAVHILPAGERIKTLATWAGVLDRLVEIEARRDACLVALGGGVVGDIGGFAAATYMRGIRFLQAPTTLLAQVDASIGGKTGVNHARGKNLIGAFHQPGAVFIDTNTLATLAAREYNAGLAEVVKYGAIMDPEFLDWLEASAGGVRARDHAILARLLQRCVECKAGIVAEDERERGRRAILNFGHSFGHALEAATDYSEYLHGEAVAIGMVIAARLSEQRGLCPHGSADRLDRLLRGFDLPTRLPDHVPDHALLRALGLDKKAVAGALRLILLRNLGQAVIDADSTLQNIVTALGTCRA